MEGGESEQQGRAGAVNTVEGGESGTEEGIERLEREKEACPESGGVWTSPRDVQRVAIVSGHSLSGGGWTSRTDAEHSRVSNL